MSLKNIHKLIIIGLITISPTISRADITSSPIGGSSTIESTGAVVTICNNESSGVQIYLLPETAPMAFDGGQFGVFESEDCLPFDITSTVSDAHANTNLTNQDVYQVNYYDGVNNISDPMYRCPETVELVFDLGTCGGEEPPPDETGTTTTAVTDYSVNFGLSIIIVLLSLMLCSMIYNHMTKKEEKII